MPIRALRACRRGAWVVLCLLPAFTWRGAARELKYPEGIGPGDQVSGSDGEFFRYKHVFVKPPDDEDRIEALRMANDVKCTACEVLLQHLLKRAETLTEDHIMDQLDGELEKPAELSTNEQENRVNRNRKGCNKHFKDDILLRGWSVRKCDDASSPLETSSEKRTWCLVQSERLPSERDVDTYSVHNEATFLACEGTIGRNGAEIAASVAEMKEDGVVLSEIIARSCKKAGRCEAAKKRKGKSKKNSKADL
eukprot:TRINITY_DN63242_c0_g1_i1.p1 TRINITY_DN63242_c0_g1~~TRINITY_DN63242_c0_g1_i1.p1  ORF type:complete len:251 (-),score=54.51 TRINITY_DN63242_c0_g1_i1:64-816(-)